PPVTTRYPRQRALTVSDPAERREGPPYPTDGSLARHLMQYLVDDGFDLACAFQSRPGANLDEAFTLLQRIYDPAASVAYVPFAISRYLPNQATPRRCYQLGNALRRAVEAWDVDRRVVIMASGGLSHQIIDEALDRSVIDALVSSDSEALCSVSRERLNGAPGTLESLKEKVALSCRILAQHGLVKGSTGHVSTRHPESANVLVRGRPAADRGL